MFSTVTSAEDEGLLAMLTFPRANLDQVTEMAQKVANQMCTAAVSLDRCSVPNRGPQEGLSFQEVEYGMGGLLNHLFFFCAERPGASHVRIMLTRFNVARYS